MDLGVLEGQTRGDYFLSFIIFKLLPKLQHSVFYLVILRTRQFEQLATNSTALQTVEYLCF